MITTVMARFEDMERNQLGSKDTHVLEFESFLILIWEMPIVILKIIKIVLVALC